MEEETEIKQQLRKKESLLTVIARFIKYNKYFALFVLILVMLIYMTVFGNKGLLHRVDLESEKQNLEQQMKAETERTKQLQQEVEDLNKSDEKIEKVAREKYGLTKEGERIYKVTVDSTK